MRGVEQIERDRSRDRRKKYINQARKRNKKSRVKPRSDGFEERTLQDAAAQRISRGSGHGETDGVRDTKGGV